MTQGRAREDAEFVLLLVFGTHQVLVHLRPRLGGSFSPRLRISA